MCEMSNRNKSCPCGYPAQYKNCCGQYIENDSTPDTAEQLMRSRFSAFALAEYDYLLATTAEAKKRVEALRQLERSNEGCRWLSLEIISKQAGELSDGDGLVEFVAMYFQDGKVASMHEVSSFKKVNNGWLYIDGFQKSTAEPIEQSLNAPCFCGSGKKFKRCHG